MPPYTQDYYQVGLNNNMEGNDYKENAFNLLVL